MRPLSPRREPPVQTQRRSLQRRWWMAPATLRHKSCTVHVEFYFSIYSFGEELKYRSRIATGISIFIFADQSAKLRCIETSSRRFVLVAHDQWVLCRYTLLTRESHQIRPKLLVLPLSRPLNKTLYAHAIGGVYVKVAANKTLYSYGRRYPSR